MPTLCLSWHEPWWGLRIPEFRCAQVWLSLRSVAPCLLGAWPCHYTGSRSSLEDGQRVPSWSAQSRQGLAAAQLTCNWSLLGYWHSTASARRANAGKWGRWNWWVACWAQSLLLIALLSSTCYQVDFESHLFPYQAFELSRWSNSILCAQSRNVAVALQFWSVSRSCAASPTTDLTFPFATCLS